MCVCVVCNTARCIVDGHSPSASASVECRSPSGAQAALSRSRSLVFHFISFRHHIISCAVCTPTQTFFFFFFFRVTEILLRHYNRVDTASVLNQCVVFTQLFIDNNNNNKIKKQPPCLCVFVCVFISRSRVYF